MVLVKMNFLLGTRVQSLGKPRQTTITRDKSINMIKGEYKQEPSKDEESCVKFMKMTKKISMMMMMKRRRGKLM